MKNHKNRSPVKYGAAIIAVLFVLALVSACSTQGRDYKEAVDLFAAGSYAEAEEAFDEIADYKDAQQLSIVSRVYQYLEQGKYADAARFAGQVGEYEPEDEDVQDVLTSVREKYYQKAGNLFQSDDMKNSSYILRCLGNYRDAKPLSGYCEGLSLIQDGNLDAAATKLEGLGDFKDAAQQADVCRKYVRATELYESGDDASLAEALDLFNEVGPFMDAPEIAEECDKELTYRAARKMADDGNFDGAYLLLSDYLETDDADIQALIEECENEIQYAEADALFEAGEYYRAYKAFGALGSFKDSADRAQGCIQAFPDNGVTYRNPDHKSTAVKFTVDNKGFKNTYIKFYNADEELIICAFIKANEKATLRLPAGTYHMNQAYGDNWFGEDAMFGDEGKYWKCKIGGAYEFKLRSGYSYTMSSGGGGDSVSTESIGTGAF